MNANYCGKMMYTEDVAKSVVRKSKGILKGMYYCSDCDAYHVTKQVQSPARRRWFESHQKQYRNKHE